jgi:hypothetical protein
VLGEVGVNMSAEINITISGFEDLDTFLKVLSGLRTVLLEVANKVDNLSISITLPKEVKKLAEKTPESKKYDTPIRVLILNLMKPGVKYRFRDIRKLLRDEGLDVPDGTIGSTLHRMIEKGLIKREEKYYLKV